MEDYEDYCDRLEYQLEQADNKRDEEIDNAMFAETEADAKEVISKGFGRYLDKIWEYLK
jgi:hypothetical protein